jgi:hypothetical protein
VTADLLAESQKKLVNKKWFTVQNVAQKTRTTRRSALTAMNLWLVAHESDVNGDKKKVNASGYPTADQSQD